MPKRTIKPNENFSKTLNEMRNIAIAITKNKKLSVKYCPDMPTSACNMESEIFEIMLSLQPYPDFIKFSPRLARKILDGDLGHECGHLVLSKPLWAYYSNWVTKIKRSRGFFKLAHEICNLVEDKRINHFIILRYRFDIGKRLLLANLVLKDMLDNAIEQKVISKSTIGESMQNTPLDTHSDVEITQTVIEPNQQEGVYMVAILCNQGLYEAKCTKFWANLGPEATKDCQEALKVMEEVKYKRLRIDMIRACQRIYELVAKHLTADYTNKDYLVSRRGGKIKGKLSEKLKQLLEEQDKKEKQQEEQKKHLEDLGKGSGAGEGSYSFDSLVYVKVNGKLWYGSVGELEQVLQPQDKLEVFTVESYREKTNWKSWKEKKRVYHKIVWKEAKLINHGIGFVYEITLKSGRKIKVTANHNFFKEKWEHSELEMIRTDQLKIGDSVAIPSILPIETEDYSFGYSHIDDDYLYFVGLWLADGNYGSRCVEISLNIDKDKPIIEKLRQFAERIKVGFSTKLEGRGNKKGITIRFFSKGFMGKLYALGCDYPKEIPNWIFLCSNRQIRAFLNGYEDGDGSKSADSDGTIRINCVDRTVLEGLQTLYLRLGIFTHLSFKRTKGKGHLGKGTYCLETTLTTYPEITFRRVKSIESVGYETIYDFSVPETEKFIANNILLHNTGEEIPAPQPNFEAYAQLLDECKPEITQLLNQLKKQLKPRVNREIFQKRGRMMSPIIPRIYTNSFRGTVRNVYISLSSKFEKEQVCIQFLFDYSGSVPKEEAEKITTILNEVFGHYVDDYGFGITAFGADTQRIKTPFETFENTRARIGGISVDAGGTEVSVGLEAILKMFNTIKGERRKILVVASDFSFSDEDKATELMQQYAKAGIECMFIGFASCENVETFAQTVRGLKVSRTRINEIPELPQKFLNVYLGVQLQK